MSEVSFYLLSSGSVYERHLYVCRLAEKIYRLGHTCYVLTESEAHSQLIDDLLWTFRAGSFIPHSLYNLQSAEPLLNNKVLIGSVPAPKIWGEIVINVSFECVSDANRILEVIHHNAAIKQAGRERYRHYQQRGDQITTHPINI